jgi:hypothetical protein
MRLSGGRLTSSRAIAIDVTRTLQRVPFFGRAVSWPSMLGVRRSSRSSDPQTRTHLANDLVMAGWNSARWPGSSPSGERTLAQTAVLHPAQLGLHPS